MTYVYDDVTYEYDDVTYVHDTINAAFEMRLCIYYITNMHVCTYIHYHVYRYWDVCMCTYTYIIIYIDIEMFWVHEQF